MRKVIIFDYDSIFTDDIENTISRYGILHSERAFSVNICKSRDYPSESIAGAADLIIHTGGDGKPVREDAGGIPKLYICHSHQWKAKTEGGLIVRLNKFIRGVRFIDVLEDDEILGKRGRMPIMQHHMFGIVRPPRSSKVLATSRARKTDGEEVEIIEALRYPDGSISIQGHPEEGTAAHVMYNFFDRIGKKEEIYHGAFRKDGRLDKKTNKNR